MGEETAESERRENEPPCTGVRINQKDSGNSALESRPSETTTNLVRLLKNSTNSLDGKEPVKESEDRD